MQPLETLGDFNKFAVYASGPFGVVIHQYACRWGTDLSVFHHIGPFEG